jgi:YVTN family beta-propeller protein
VEFAILGPVEVRSDGERLPLGGRRVRALMALLLLDADQVVSRDRLIDGLWGERPPVTASRTLDSHVSRLRTALGADRIERRPPGYLLRVEQDELDLARFERLLAEGRLRLDAGDPADAIAAFDKALALWRGSALADLLDEPFAGDEARRLEERRLLCREERIDAQLALGGAPDVVPELERLVAEHPFRERLLGQLMVALYRSGRQADALAAYQRGRGQLVAELGLEPSLPLRQLERQILDHDPVLGASSVAPARRTSGRRWRPATFVAAAVAAVAASAAVGIGLGTPGSRAALGEHGLSDKANAATMRALPPGGQVVARIPIGRGNEALYQVGGGPLAVGQGAVWAMSDASSTLMRIDPVRNAIVARIKVDTPEAVVAGDGAVWLSNPSYNTVTRVDPETNTVTANIPVGPTPEGIAVSPGAVWVANAGHFPACRSTVSRIDPATNRVVATISIGSKGDGCAEHTNLVASPRAVWVALTNGSSVAHIDPTTNEVLATVPIGFQPCGFLALDETGVWLTATRCGGGPATEWPDVVARVDSRTNTPTTTVPEPDPSAVAVAFGTVWVTAAGNVDQIDPHTGRHVARLHVGEAPDQLGVGFGSMWVNDDVGAVLRIKPQS